MAIWVEPVGIQLVCWVGRQRGALGSALDHPLTSVPGRGRRRQPDPGKAQCQPGHPVWPCPWRDPWRPHGAASAAGGEKAPPSPLHPLLGVGLAHGSGPRPSQTPGPAGALAWEAGPEWGALEEEEAASSSPRTSVSSPVTWPPGWPGAPSSSHSGGLGDAPTPSPPSRSQDPGPPGRGSFHFADLEAILTKAGPLALFGGRAGYGASRA